FELFQEKMRNYWKKLVVNFDFSEDFSDVKPAILDSWQRCMNLPISPFQKAAPLVLVGNELDKHKLIYRELISTSLPIMENMYRFVAEGGFIVILADPSGILLEVLGDDDIRKSVEKGHFMPGADWSEEAAGTNAIGTSLKLNCALQVAGYEHFCISSHQWTCSAAVIHGPDGEQAGVVDITGPNGKAHSHTLGMVVTAANAIEALLKLNRTMRSLELSNAYKNAIIECISQGLLAIDTAGYVTHANNTGAEIFGLTPDKILNKKCEEVFGPNAITLSRIIDRPRHTTDEEITVTVGQQKQSYLVTSRPIKGPTDHWSGTILSFSEMARARKLVHFLSGNEAKFTFDDLIGQDEKFLESIRMARAVADSTSNVLLLGESGTGKDMIAQAIHNASRRKNAPFMVINCGAIPKELIASELFGYVEGAFTGARRGGKPGKFELANGGTIFLDEIGEMPLELQVFLLRAIENKAIVRVGGSDSIPVDVRIIAATNKSLEKEILRGNFRLDLFYRLNVVCIKTVPLRDRKRDIPLLVEHFLRSLYARMNKEINEISLPPPEAMAMLMSYDWPGNVRELQNALERAVNLGDNFVTSFKMLLSSDTEVSDTRLDYGSTAGTQELESLKELLVKHGRNITRVAREMGVARTTVYRKLEKYGL
ncbi:MAG: sigma 54-interacting transcriptional regulator, partial [Candidatus Methanomethyliaceae archaeon]